MSRSLDRREFMAAAGGVALAAGALGRGTAAYAQAEGPPDVIVIGAGLSGLESARIIEEAGFSVQVIEGRERIGGRLYTRFDLPGHTELGGNSAGPGYGRLIAAAKRGGVELVNVLPRQMRNSDQLLVLDGKITSREEWSRSERNPFPAESKTMLPWEYLPRSYAALNPLESAADWYGPQHRPDDISLHAFLKSQGWSDETIGFAFDTNPAYGDNAYEVSNLMYAFIGRWAEAQMAAMTEPAMYAAKGGNQLIAESMAKQLSRGVRLGARVAAIETGEGGATVTLASGEKLKAKAVVSSMPFSALRNVHVMPGFAGVQREAVNQLQSQNLTLAVVTPKKPYWLDDGLPVSMWTNGPAGWIAAERFGETPEDVTGLLVHGRGNVGLNWDRIGHEAAGKLIIDEIERLRPAAKGHLELAAMHSWTLDPFNCGDWALFGPGQVTRFVPEMARPHERLYFCGEHTGRGNRGMESAMESAERAAIEVLTDIG